MSDVPPTPDWAREFAENLGSALERAAQVLTAQAAMGWLFQGEFEKAQREVTKLPTDQLNSLAVAATALASIAEEEAGKRS